MIVLFKWMYEKNNTIQKTTKEILDFMENISSRANEWDKYVKKKTFDYAIDKKRIFAE